MDAWLVIAVVVIGGLVLVWARRAVRRRIRFHRIKAFERRRGSRVIAIIDRNQPWFSLTATEVFLEVDQSEQVLRAIQLTDEKVPIDLILHTPGGVVMAAEQVAAALSAHPATVTAFVPFYAMSAGTMIALAADVIVMAPVAALGPVDPQLGEHSAASIIRTAQQKPASDLDDATLMMAEDARKSQVEARAFLERILVRSVDPLRVRELATALTDGRWTHDFPISATRAREMGLRVSTDMPPEITKIVSIQPRQILQDVVWYRQGEYRSR
jgi:ClpP class serine protease